ncbi:MAG: hypothetical protein KC766_22480 [Myxococcales bacterium]|nr:hypothetical protein [Myxococcales bacterium]
MSMLQFLIQFVLNIALPWWIVRLSLKVLPRSAHERAWNEASFRSAVVVFGPLALPVHFARVGAGPERWHWALRVPMGLGLGMLVMFLELSMVGLVVALCS